MPAGQITFGLGLELPNLLFDDDAKCFVELDSNVF
jgi:hypothetical protein